MYIIPWLKNGDLHQENIVKVKKKYILANFTAAVAANDRKKRYLGRKSQ